MKIVPGAIVGKISGSLGGMTASHNRGGYYLRNRVVPVNPNTARQQTVRSAFGSLVQAWLTALTDSERAGWELYATNTPRTDTLGQSLTLSGQQAFIGANAPRIQAGLDAVIDAPTTYNTGEPVTASDAEIDGTQLTVNVGLATETSDAGQILVYVGRTQNTSVRAVRGPWQLIGHAAIQAETDNGAMAVDLSAWDGYPVSVDVPQPFRIRIAYDDGRLSQPWQGLLTPIDTTE